MAGDYWSPAVIWNPVVGDLTSIDSFLSAENNEKLPDILWYSKKKLTRIFSYALWNLLKIHKHSTTCLSKLPALLHYIFFGVLICCNS